MRLIPLLVSLLIAVPAAAQQTETDSSRVYELAEVEVMPQPQNAPEFAAALGRGYPAELRAAGVGGTVQVSFVIAPDGQVGDVRVLSASDSAFGAPSVQAVSLLRFTPAQVAGQPVAVRVQQPITWRVEAPPAPAPAPAAEDEEGGYEIAMVEVLPRIANARAFQQALMRNYPPVLRDAGVEGMVEVRFRVEEDGSVTRARVVRISDAAFLAPTLQALGVLRFRPAQVDGRPVKAWVQIPIEYRLGGAGMSSPANDLMLSPHGGRP